ncbi:GatB/YqeY domain-containing protein [Aeromicrobium sp. CF3.5]|uniref:GatB/YqeY domain-containing protein n=1 Tax=Aeromicrobium sp. CF3.5 TaxID=3373078 RepID=UPI003EE45787
MSDLKDRLRADLTTAIKARDQLRSSTIRMVLTAITNVEVGGKAAREVSDAEVLDVLGSEVKKRREAAEAFADGNRPEMAQKERDEAQVLAEYLPAQMSGEEIADIVTSAIESTGTAAGGMRGMGTVMGVVTPQTKGKADSAAVAAEVKRQLGA